MAVIVTLAFGHPVYKQMADILAASIKAFGNVKGAEIRCYVDEQYPFKHVDNQIILEKDTYTDNGKVAPAKAKLSLHRYMSKGESWLFVDADTICVNSIEHLLSFPDEFKIQHLGLVHFDQKGEEMGNMIWAKKTQMWEHFQLDKTRPIVASNSSLIWIGEHAKALPMFALAAYEQMRFPIADMPKKWGRYGMQPDELYWNAGFNLCGAFDCSFDPREPIKFQHGNDPTVYDYAELVSKHSFFGIYHGSHRQALKRYDMAAAQVGYKVRSENMLQDKLQRNVKREQAV